MNSMPSRIIQRPRASDLLAIVLLSAIAACDVGPPDDAPSEPSARAGAYEPEPESGDEAARAPEPSPACPIPDGPWRRGGVLGPDEFSEFMAAFEAGCPQAARATPSREPLDFVALEPQDTTSPDTFCTTDWPKHLIASTPLPARADEIAVVPARFEVERRPTDGSDLTPRHDAIPTSDLVDPSEALRLVGLDGTWRPDSAEAPAP